MISSSSRSGSPPSASKRRLHPRDVAVVVGAHSVDQPVEAALALVQQVGDVGGEVRVLAASSARARGPCRRRTSVVRSHSAPVGAVAACPRARRALERVRDRRRLALVQRSLREPDVELDAKRVRATRGSARACSSTPRRASSSTSARRRRPGSARGELDDVVALVAALGDSSPRARARDRLAELATCDAEVVDVVLARRRRGREARGSARARRRRRRCARGRRAAARSGWRRRTRRRSRSGALGAARRRSARPRRARGERLARTRRRPRTRLRKPGPGDLDALERRAEPLAELLGQPPAMSRGGRRAPAPAASPRSSSSRRSRPASGARASARARGAPSRSRRRARRPRRQRAGR